MTLKKRAINIQFIKGGEEKDNKKDEKPETVTLTGHRVEAIIQNVGGGLAPQVMQMRVFGMQMSDMNKFSTDGMLALATRGDQIILSAGDEGGVVNQIFQGTINSATVDYTSAPDVSFSISSVAGYYHKMKPAQANSYRGYTDVATIIEGLAKSIGYGFKNNGVNAQLGNPYLDGTVIDQIESVVNDARIGAAIENGVISIWPNGSSRDSTVIEISPETGMIGYPTFTPTGIVVRSVFNANALMGRRAKATSSIEKACGEWFVHTATHELSTMMPGGPWFTLLSLSRASFYASAF